MATTEAEYHITVSWLETTRDPAANVVRVAHAAVYSAPDLPTARALYARAKEARGWVPATAQDVQIDLLGAVEDPVAPAQVTRESIAAMRAALSGCRGPVAVGLQSAVRAAA